MNSILCNCKALVNRSLINISYKYVSTINRNQFIFDRNLIKKHKEYSIQYNKNDQYYNYLKKESATNIIDRLDDINRSFPNVLELGSYRGDIYNIINNHHMEYKQHEYGKVGGILNFTQSDIMDIEYIGIDNNINNTNNADCDITTTNNTTATISSSNNNNNNNNNNIKDNFNVNLTKLQFDEEETFPLEPKTFDLVLSSLSLHWINDIPKILLQIKSVLKSDGTFIASMFGSNTLQELRHCFYLAESERKGGVSPHTSPLAKSSDVAALMQGAGFSLPTIDIDTITITYPNAITLMEHIIFMGEGNSTLNRQYHVGTDTFLAMASIYQSLYGLEDGSVTATFEIVYMIGWVPDESQPKACRRGSAQVSIKDALKN